MEYEDATVRHIYKLGMAAVIFGISCNIFFFIQFLPMEKSAESAVF